MSLTRPKYSSIYDTDYKQSVRLATTEDVGNLLISGNITNTVDSVTVEVGDRILVKDQSDSKQNGIYRVITVGTGNNGTWVRDYDADANGNNKVTSGMTTTVSTGISNQYTTWKLTTQDPIVVGSTSLTFINPFLSSSLVGGPYQAIQFNDSGVVGGVAGLVFNKTSNVLTVGNTVSSNNLIVSNGINVNGTYGSFGQILESTGTAAQWTTPLDPVAMALIFGGGGDPAPDPNMLTTISQSTGGSGVSLDLNTLVHKLNYTGTGWFTLADGQDGQLLYLVPGTGTISSIYIVVSHVRTGNATPTGSANVHVSGTFYPFSSISSSWFPTIVTGIFTDGAWNFSTGSYA